MSEKEMIAQMANNIISIVNLEQLVQIVKDFALQQAEHHYSELSEEKRKELKEKFEEARRQVENAPLQESQTETTQTVTG
jgi:replicative DNA helicase